MIVEIVRTIDATPQELFDAWLDPEALASFLAPVPGILAKEVRVDARVGGAFSLVFHLGERRVPIRGEYKELSRYTRIAFSWLDHGTTPESLVTLDFEEVAEGTQFTLRHTGFISEEERADHEEGWGEIVATLVRFVA
jgi:uncharacterized protein YndB with AHSA1/START domain